MPKVLVGVTTHNRSDILPKAIRSALTQNYQSKEIIVMDDASTDLTPGLQAQFQDVVWIRNATMQGYRNARNRMMQMPGVDYFVSLDDDAWFLQKDEIQLAVVLMEQESSIGAIAFDILSPDRSVVGQRTSPVQTGQFIGCGHVVRIDAVRKAGWYEEVPGDYGGEEKDLCLRMMNLGYQIVKLPGVHVWHDKAWDGRDWYPLHKSGVCNDLVMATRRYPFPDVLAVVPYKIFSHLRFALKKPELIKPTLAGIGMFLSNLPLVIASRRPLQRAVFRKPHSK